MDVQVTKKGGTMEKGTMEEGAVTFLDVLGWKNVWQRQEDGAIELCEQVIELLRTVVTMFGDNAGRGWAGNLGGIKTSVRGLSNTIAISSIGPAEKTLVYHSALCAMTIDIAFRKGIPLRGAVSFGDFLVKNQRDLDTTLLIGPAVDEVAAWYEAVEWIGAVLTPSSYFCWPQEQAMDESYVVEYHVPVKGKGKHTMKCVNWLREFKDEKELANGFHSMASVVTPDIAAKYQNTLDFYRHVYKR